MSKIFKFEEINCQYEEIFTKLTQIGVKLKDKLYKFFLELVQCDIPYEDPIQSDKKEKYLFHSMILSLEDVNTLYGFFKDYQEEFTTSK